MSFIVRLFRTRGARRRQQILTLLAGNPDHEYTTSEICIALADWAGVVGPDLLILHRRGKILRNQDDTGLFHYRIKPGAKVCA